MSANDNAGSEGANPVSLLDILTVRNIKKRNRVDTCYKNMFTTPPYQSRELLKRALCRYRHTNPVSHAIGETQRPYSMVLTLD